MKDILIVIMFIALWAISTVLGAMLIAHLITYTPLAFVTILMWVLFINPWLNVQLLNKLSYEQ